MNRAFDPADLAVVGAAKEVRIHTTANTAKPVIIWAVVVGDAAFVRSVRGPKGKWYVNAVANGQATLEVGGRMVSVKVVPVTDTATIAAVSQAFLSKYATSPYAQSIVAPDTLPTTLRLDPV